MTCLTTGSGAQAVGSGIRRHRKGGRDADWPRRFQDQGDVDWRKVAPKHDLAIVRVSDGDHRDAFYTELRSKRSAGRASVGTVLLRPGRFAGRQSEGRRGGGEDGARLCQVPRLALARRPPLIYDFETNNGQPNDKCAHHVVEFVRAYRKSEDHYPGIYTMPGFWAQILPHLSKSDRQLIARCFLHQAEWSVQAPRDLEPWDGATLWQFTDRGSCPGVSGGVDMNRSVAAEKAVLALAKRSERPGPEDEQSRPIPERPPKPDPEPDRPKDVPRWLPREYWDRWRKPGPMTRRSRQSSASSAGITASHRPTSSARRPHATTRKTLRSRAIYASTHSAKRSTWNASATSSATSRSRS